MCQLLGAQIQQGIGGINNLQLLCTGFFPCAHGLLFKAIALGCMPDLGLQAQHSVFGLLDLFGGSALVEVLCFQRFAFSLEPQDFFFSLGAGLGMDTN